MPPLKNNITGEDLLRRMYGGVILTVEPPVTDFKMVTSTAANELWRGEHGPAIQVLVRAHPDNSGRVWVNLRQVPSSSDGWPLDANDWVKVTIRDMYHLRLLIVTSGDKVIIARSS